MPVMYIRALTQDKQETRNFYECPVYKTRQRGPTYIWTFNLRSREKATKWILAGACLILQIQNYEASAYFTLELLYIQQNSVSQIFMYQYYIFDNTVALY